MEILGLYDINGNYLNKRIERSKKNTIVDNEYYKLVIIFIINDKGEFLIQKSSYDKGDIFEVPGGHVKDGHSSIDTLKLELIEELSLFVDDFEINYFNTFIYKNSLQEVYYINKNIDLSKLVYQTEEVSYAIWSSIDEIYNLINENKFRKKNILPFMKLLESGCFK